MNKKSLAVIIALAAILFPGVSNYLANAKQTITNPKVQGFPWKVGETWKYTQDLHGSINNGLDFGTPDGKEGDVYSVDSGVVVGRSDCTIIIRRKKDGLYHGYHHVKPDPTITKDKEVSYQTKLGKTALCGGSQAHHVHFWLHDEGTQKDGYGSTDKKDGKKDFNPVGSYFGNWQLTRERDFSENPADNSNPVSGTGYDYVLRNGTTVACAGTTTQNGKNICTTNLLTNQNVSSNNPSPTNSATFVSPGSKLTISPSTIDLQVSAANLAGKTVYVQMWRPAVAGYPAKQFPSNNSPYFQLTATGNSITFKDLDGDGPTLAGVTYYTVASLSPISSGEAERQAARQIKEGPGCFAATGGKYLCDAVRR